MTDTEKSGKHTAAVAAFDLSEMDTSDEAIMEVLNKGRPTGWLWTFAGPGHPRAIAQAKRLGQENLNEARRRSQTIANGKKWTEPVESVDELRARNANFVAERVLGWSEVMLNGKPFPYSHQAAVELLMDPRKAELMVQALEFLGDEKSFTRSSATV